METARKLSVAVPPELLERAQRASGSDITQTVRTGLPPVAASQTYARLRQLRGKVRFTRTLAEVKADRRFAVDTSTIDPAARRCRAGRVAAAEGTRQV